MSHWYKPPRRGKEKPQAVQCGACQHFRRDTEGISRAIETGEYFMGECSLGLTPHSPKKQFANKDHICNQFVMGEG